MAGAGEIVDIGKSFIPSFSGVGGGVNFFAWMIIIFLVAGGLTTGIILYIVNRKYNKKIIIFEKIGGSFVPIRKDRGMEVKFSTAGDSITYLRKHKKYIPNPSIQTGNREYWYFIREDDEWINFGLTDLDQASRDVGARFLDKEMRYARTSIQKGLKDRYEQQSAWQKYGIYILSFGYVALIGVMIWLLFDKWVDLDQTTNGAVQTAGIVLENVDRILANMDNICTGGSGLVRS